MYKRTKNLLPKEARYRSIVLILVFIAMAAILIQRLYSLQIIEGENYQKNFTMKIKKEREIKSTRGNIYDRNGELLAYNQLSYNVTFEDNGSYSSTKEKNLTLNGAMYGLMKIVEKNGDSIIDDFKIRRNSSGAYEFTTSGFSLNRFKADVFGQAYIDNMTQEQKNMTAGEMMELFINSKYGLMDSSITAEEKAEYGLPAEFTDDELIKITALRCAVDANSYQKYQTTVLARNVSNQTATEVLENQLRYQGADIQESSIRIYNKSEYFSSLIGYTGNISAEELTDLNEEGGSYNASDIVGKVGLESLYETTLQGQKGKVTLFVDSLGKTLSIESKEDAVSGDDLHLTIDSRLQEAVYNILEQYIAGILYQVITNSSEEMNTDLISSTDEITIPIYDVYNALFENNVINITEFTAEDATEEERHVAEVYKRKQESILSELVQELTRENPVTYNELSDEMKVYTSYIVDTILVDVTGILNMDLVDTTDKIYIDWKENGEISLQEFLTYAISRNWMEISRIPLDLQFADSQEVYSALINYIAEYLSKDTTFQKKVFRYMLHENSITGNDVSLLLFDQGVLEPDAYAYDQLKSGKADAYTFIKDKIYNLEITPAQLALDPCSGSCVIVDPNNGDVLACVSYPGYDTNRLANDMDTDYYMKLASDESSPFYNRATQEQTAPGSTLKIVAAIAGVMENVVSIDEPIACTGTFDLIDPAVNCWIAPGNHGVEVLSEAIKNSCNFYFNTLGYRLGIEGFTAGNEITEDMVEDDSLAMGRLQYYYHLFGLDQDTGIELYESTAHVATNDAPRSTMGQSDHLFTTSQLARYVATIANSGTCYKLTLLDSIQKSDGTILEQNEPFIMSTVDVTESLWNAVHTGMNEVVKNNSAMSDLTGIEMAGKTGTAQESKIRSNHALFVGYAPYQDPQIAMAVRIANGYTSANAASVAKDVVNYYFGLRNENEILTGKARQVVSNQNAQTD